MNKSGFHRNITGWVPALLSVLIVQASCGRKIYSPETHSVSISQSHVKREFVYYPKPKPVEVIKLDSRQPSKAKDSFQRIPPRRETVYWLKSDSVLPIRFSAPISDDIEKARKLLVRAEKKERQPPVYSYPLMGKMGVFFFSYTIISSFTIEGLYYNSVLGWILGLFAVAALFGSLGLFGSSLFKYLSSGYFLRKRAARLIYRAPKNSTDAAYSSDKLASLSILRNYVPAYRLKRQLKRLHHVYDINMHDHGIDAQGTPEEKKLLAELERFARQRARTERLRATLRTLKVVFFILGIIGSLIALAIGSMDIGGIINISF